jgi:hypothetical protein
VSEPNAAERAATTLEIMDVFLASTNCWVARDLNQTERHPDNLHSMHRIRVEENLVTQTRIPTDSRDQKLDVLRFFVDADVHIARPGIQFTDGELEDKDALAKLNLVFAADYRTSAPPEAEALGAFTQNVIYHVWPYWRAAVHDLCGKLRIPSVTVPLLKLPPMADQSIGNRAARAQPPKVASDRR